MKALLLSGDIIDLLYNSSDKLNGIHIEMSDSDVRQNLYFNDPNPRFNINILGAIVSAEDYILREINKFETKQDKLWTILKDFKNKNEIGEPTYHLEYSKNKRGNPKIRQMLEERGLGESYLEDSVDKMTAYNPDKKFNIKELKNLKGTGLDLKKHEKNLFPERIAYLETIMENDKEFESEPRPLEKFEQRPYGWPEEDKLAEEDFDEVRRERDVENLYDKSRVGTSRKLQKDWYKQQGWVGEDEASQLLEDNPVFKQSDVNQKIRKTLRNRYDYKTRSNLPATRLGLKNQLKNRKYTMQRQLGRDVANRLDRVVEDRFRGSQRRARELDEDILRQSRLIDGRTPVQVMNLEQHLRPRLNRDFATSDNLRRRIDRQRDNRESAMRRERSLFNRENSINSSNSS
jgi:hypothetical protein